jgi:hypothetical protein
MKTYTVVGMYEEYGEIFAEQVIAEDAHSAIRLVAVAKNAAGADAEILGAIESAEQFVVACEDSGHAAHVCDLGGDGVEILDDEGGPGR